MNALVTEPQYKHYYGNVVRAMFFGAGLIMLLGLPYFVNMNLIPVPIFFSVATILLLGLFAGIINPIQPVTIIIDFIVSLAGLLVFENYALASFNANPWAFFLVNQALAILFFVSLYYSTKSLRGYFVPHRSLHI